MQLVLKFLVSPDNNGKMPKPSKNNHELSDLFVNTQKLFEEQNLDVF